jgi:AcrR family transcriptional regulator
MSNPKSPSDSPTPIWTQPAPGSRRPKLTREQIALAALQIADTIGFESVSMRRVAEALGVGTMTLYYYVRTKNDLLALMEDALMGEVLVSEAEVARPWREAMTAIARSTREVFLRHPWALFVPDGGRVGPNSLKHMEQSIAALGEIT